MCGEYQSNWTVNELQCPSLSYPHSQYSANMRTSDFDYDLPEQLIAQQPLADRSASRLLQVSCETDAFSERVFADLPQLLRSDDLLVMNNSRVLPARLWASKTTGARVELLLERLLDAQTMLCQARSNRKLQTGIELVLDGQQCLQVEGREDSFYRIRSSAQPLLDLLHDHGHMPLPPYIKRAADQADIERYQTVYARTPGSVAAPTAGLHFDQALLQQLDAAGIERVEVTLHVGAGTFQPLRSESILQHQMHAECYQISATAAAAINAAKQDGRRIIAVGTTSLRTLESAADEAGRVQAGSAESRLFIYPGYRFRVIDGLITNFHLPRSTLMMLVAALAGRERIMAAYEYAISRQFRFFSYGDAMLIT